MKILILGIDGYIGWPLALHLKGRGHEVTGIDNLIRRHRIEHEGSTSLIPIDGIKKRGEQFDIRIETLRFLKELDTDLDAIVHLAEQPSAPWSMKSPETAFKTQRDNVLGTLNLLWLMIRCCPRAHLVKLGSMGEYGTPGVDIPEGFIEGGELAGMMFPRQPGSFYHLSKVFDTYNIEFACKTWGLTSTDIMQGIVFGHLPGTRFDYDECFGTVINRFCVQAAAGIPLTVYGSGDQKRGYLPLKDSLECLTIALENPPDAGRYRVFNQFAKIYSINELARQVQLNSPAGMHPKIQHIDNPRVEDEDHEYQAANDCLRFLGYHPDWRIIDEIAALFESIMPHRDSIRSEVILPKIWWKQGFWFRDAFKKGNWPGAGILVDEFKKQYDEAK